MYIGIFCGPRASEVLGLQWKSWTGATLVPHGTTYEGQFYPGRFKTRSSRAPIGVPEQVRPIIQAWQQACADLSPKALMFPTFGRGERTGQAVPRWGKNFFKWRVRPIARKLGIPDRLITFQVMRRTLGTDLQEHGTLKDAQGHFATRASRRRVVSICKPSRARAERDELQDDTDSCRLGTSRYGRM
jgi:integrase